MQIGRKFVREQKTRSVPEYQRRVYILAAIYVGITVTAATAIGLIIDRGKLLVTLAQRSNVETLTIAFVLVLFGYIGLMSLPGAWGAVWIVYANLPAWLGGDRGAVEKRKHASLAKAPGEPVTAYLSCLVRREGRGDEPVRIPIRDEAGSMGEVVIDGARMQFVVKVQEGSSGVLAYFKQRIESLVRERDPEQRLEIVEWGSIDDEAAEKYGSFVRFSVNLERQLGKGPLWPAVTLLDRDVEQLTREGTELCPALRDEVRLPDLEYQAEHRLPIIPEPLAFVALSRSEQRADPVASMGCALLVALGLLAVVVFFVLFPPWVPGK